ncbi:MAG: tRNA (guanosine(37)-N1)-methyltransferase TrmD [Acidimicrobiia bacterium]|nr:tRNA (guanosine(37)-N1)-methyltransferase TrmD [Acidimicrobiia bacterium]
MTFQIDVFTLFPEYITGPSSLALLGKAQEQDLVSIKAYNFRDYTYDVHHSVDDQPYGGGAGMVLSAKPIFDAIKDVKPQRPLYVLSASGRKFDQKFARELSLGEGFSLISGRYEGIDQRVGDELADGEISIGDFILAGGEVAALVVIEAVTRLIPGVMGNDESHIQESFDISDLSTNDLVEFPQYTRPADFEGYKVPDVLLSGNHKEIAKWRLEQSKLRTAKNRPDLLGNSD